MRPLVAPNFRAGIVRPRRKKPAPKGQRSPREGRVRGRGRSCDHEPCDQQRQGYDGSENEGVAQGCVAAVGAHATTHSWWRRTLHSTSGRRSSQRTAPRVARSISGQCSAGIPPRDIQLFTVCLLFPMALARADCDPRMLIACVSAFMNWILHTWGRTSQHVRIENVNNGSE